MLYQTLKPYLDKSPALTEFDRLALSGQELFCANLNLTTKALLASRIFHSYKPPRHLVFVTTDCNRAEEYYEDFVLLLGKENVAFLPDYETLPYEEHSPHYSIRAKRLEVLERVLSGKPVLLTLSLKSLLRKIICPRLLQQSFLVVGRDIVFDLDLLTSKLLSFGYEMQTEVTKVGEISRRGGILDVYTPSQKYPVRLEFFGDEIASCRYFDPFTQTSTVEIPESIKIIPAREVSLDDISSENPAKWEKILSQGFYEGIEQDVSLLYDNTATVIEYLSHNGIQIAPGQECKPLLIFDEYPLLEGIEEELRQDTAELYLRKTTSLASKSKKTGNSPASTGQPVTLHTIPTPEMLFARLKDIRQDSPFRCCFSALQSDAEPRQDVIVFHSPFLPQVTLNRDMSMLQDILDEKLDAHWTVLIQSDNQSQSKRMQEMLSEFGSSIRYEIGVLHRGFELPDAKLLLYTDHEIFNRYKQRKYQDYFPAGESLVDYESLKPGDYIVHIEHGIGLYEGLKLMKVNKSTIECLSIKYAGDARVYVPTYQLKLVTRFVSDDGVVPEVHKLGGKRWEQSKNRAKKQIELIADDLVKLYAERTVRKGIAFEPDPVWQNEMEESFIYEDTPDQRRATEEIKADMERENPMERLLCGDVGFGKTEVAVRAAFKAVTGGYQVAVLVPTTLLAEQHYNVFRERLAQYPVNIAMFSRFRTSAQVKRDLDQLKLGKIDIAIGTHRLLSGDVVFSKLGLLIIDEEHRFGVRHKDKMRKIKSNVDTLYMSATPIPRTLNMALTKLKEMSLIQTSPKARLPIRTNIITFNINIIRDAIKRELDRGGQILFVHNRIETISSIAERLQEALPQAKIVIGHGQLPERMLEQIMLDFYDCRYDILVATTIIESGIDIPNANTIFINRADMFGLAQLYQIRGRVGRSNRRAYAYLIIPDRMQHSARLRLEALSEYTALGSGYQIAMRDLELRGAGTLLGTKQSGVINSIGFNYYNRLLDEAVNNLVQGKETIWNDEKSITTEKTGVDADFFFPSDYIRDEKTRLDFYTRMLNLTDPEQFDVISAELRDRFGELPPPARRGLLYFRIKMLTDKAQIDAFRIDKHLIIVRFDKKRLPPKDMLLKIISATAYPVKFDDSRQALILTVTLPPDFASDKEKILKIAEQLLLLLQ